MSIELTLEKLREVLAEFNRLWVSRGGKLTSWKCPHCAVDVACRQPTPEDIAPGRECWSSLVTCYNCGEASAVRVYPDGKTEVVTEWKREP